MEASKRCEHKRTVTDYCGYAIKAAVFMITLGSTDQSGGNGGVCIFLKVTLINGLVLPGIELLAFHLVHDHSIFSATAALSSVLFGQLVGHMLLKNTSQLTFNVTLVTITFVLCLLTSFLGMFFILFFQFKDPFEFFV